MHNTQADTTEIDTISSNFFQAFVVRMIWNFEELCDLLLAELNGCHGKYWAEDCW